MENYSNLQCDHIDRNSLNDSPENLRWVTPSQNILNRNKFEKSKHRKMLLIFDNQQVMIYDSSVNKDFYINHTTLYTLARGLQGTHYSKKYGCYVYWIDDEAVFDTFDSFLD